MKEKVFENENNKWLFRQFAIINKTAMFVYESVQGGKGQNFYACNMEENDGIYGWIKESFCFLKALEIYEYFTANESSDIISELEDVFGDELRSITYKQIVEIENEINSEK